MSEISTTVATWNIAGGRLARSSEMFDYQPGEHLDYFAGEIAKIRPGVLCVQELHINNSENPRKPSFTQHLAEKLDMPYYHEMPMHRSHIDGNYTIGIGILATQAFSFTAVELSQPDLPPMLKNGDKLIPHPRWLEIADFGGFAVATMHNWPLRAFAMSYDEGEGATYARELEEVYLDALPVNQPLVLAGDFNFDPKEVTPNLLKKLELSGALPIGQPTSNAGLMTSNILHSSQLSVAESGIIPGPTDSYLCYARFAGKSANPPR